jgi:hypothetical protein
MKQSEIEEVLKRQSRETGIPAKELRRMCLVGGLDLLDAGKLVVKRKVSAPEKSNKEGGAA